MTITTDDFPQADFLSKVLRVAEAVARGYKADWQIENYIGMDSGGRQGRYHRLAAELLGLVENSANHAELTSMGLQLTAAAGEERRALVQQAVLSNEPMRRLWDYVGQAPRSHSQITSFLRDLYPGASSTSDRRRSSMLNWLRDSSLIDELDGRYSALPSTPPPSAQHAVPSDQIADPSPVPAVSELEQPVLPADEGAQPTDQWLRIDVDLQRRERANQLHESLVRQMQQLLVARGIDARPTERIDLAASHRGRNVIYEMKSLDPSEDNVVSQIRKAVAQLYEYSYRPRKIDAALCIVVNALPTSLDWLYDYLTGDRGIALLAIHDGQVELTPSSAELLEDWMR